METSEAINEIATALAKAQAAMQKAAKDSTNPHFRSKYADLSSITDACRDALTANGIAVIQAPGSDDGTVVLTTRLVHSSGQWMQTVMSCRPLKADAQAMGSVISYLRRYCLASMVGVVADDDDGNAGSGRGGSDARELGHLGSPPARDSGRPATNTPDRKSAAHEAAAAIQAPSSDFDPTDEPATVPYTASNGRVYDIGVDNAVQRLWKACEAAEVSDEAFDDLLRRNERWMERHAKTALASMRQTKSAVAA